LTELKTLPTALEAAATCGIPQKNIFVLNYRDEEISAEQQSWKELLKHEEKDWVKPKDPSNTPAAYVSTSGTSGLPKAAIITHAYLISQGEFQEKMKRCNEQVRLYSPLQYITAS
jgi:acyl-coenzyme A synthetase/AMP-(fatty) acid ligase